MVATWGCFLFCVTWGCFDIERFFVASVNYQDLYARYKNSLELDGEEAFRRDVLEPLRDEERSGVVISTGVMDENTSIRRSAIPVELRLKAAEGALLDFRSGGNGRAGGVRVVSVDRGWGCVEL